MNVATGRSDRWAVVCAVSLPLAVLTIDFGGASVALPSIGADLDVNGTSLTWVINAFALGAGAPLIVAGRVADRVGRRRVLLAGLFVFTVATLVAGAAPTYPVLVVARVSQGVGTALFMAPSLGILVASFDDPFRTKAIGVWSAAGGAALAGGPIVGGVLTEVASWRWFFLVNVPILLAAMAMVGGWVPESRDADAEPPDPLSGAAITATIGFLMLAVQSLAGDTGALVAWLGWTGLALSAATLIWSERRAASAIVDRAILASRNYLRSSTVAFLSNWGFGAANFLLTLYLQDILGWSALEAGLAFLLYSLPFAIVGFTLGPITARLGLTGPLTVGMALIAASFCLIALTGVAGGATPALWGLGVSGVGQGLVFNLTTSACMSAVATNVSGAASGVLATVRNVGIVCGVTLATVLAEAGGGALPESVTPGAAVPDSTAQEFTDGLVVASLAIAAISVAGTLVATRVRPEPA